MKIFGMLLLLAQVVFAETYRFQVDKMTCAACISTLKKATAKYAELSNVRVSLETKELEFQCNKEKAADCRVDALLSDLEKKGYPAKRLP
jgi:cation transport ATPase